MNPVTKEATPPVSPEEVARRIAEYRRLGFEQQAAAQVVYQKPNLSCPWPDCGLRIAGISFRLEKMGDQAVHSRLLAAWWQGPGLVGRCPRCNRYVLFGLGEKRRVTDPALMAQAVLPEDWHQRAHLVVKSP
jgi:hypothetical protein